MTDDLIERLRSVKWEVTDDGDRMPDDPTYKCVFVDMRPDDFRALLEEAAAALEAAREDARVLRRGNERLAEALREWWSTHRPVGWTEDQHRARPYVNLITVADKALTEALLRDQEASND